MKKHCFSITDWMAFLAATLVTFAVYFFTLGPSVGLEDSGELATAAAHLGVPHPPGYPFWTLCSWIFCKVFSFVTYMGHPTPAWCVSLCSATFGAFAAGFTAMLICRSAMDFLTGEGETESALNRWLCFSGAVAGALTFSLSPVEWSQSTIVEIYSLNAFFLMAVFLLTYKWLKKPTDAALFATAFVFGLGLTNYQVLLFAIIPIALVIYMKSGAKLREAWAFLALTLLGITFTCLTAEAAFSRAVVAIAGAAIGGYLVFYAIPKRGGLFRDVIIYLMPVALTCQILQIGSLEREDPMMQSDVIVKHLPVGAKASNWFSGAEGARTAFSSNTPSSTLLALALAAFLVGVFVAMVMRERRRFELARKTVLGAGGAAVALLLLSITVFGRAHTWTDAAVAPLAEPWKYVFLAALAVVSVGAAIAAACRDNEVERHEEGEGEFALPLRNFATNRGVFAGETKKYAIVSAAAGAALVFFALVLVPQAETLTVTTSRGVAKYSGEVYAWGKSFLMCFGICALTVYYALCTRRGVLFAMPAIAVQLAAFILLKHGAMNGLTHPASWWFVWPIVWNLALLGLSWATLPNGRSVAGSAFFTQLGVAFYAYMPIVSDLRNPPMNWGYPRTWEGFKHAIMRGQYEAIGIPQFNSFGDYLWGVNVQGEERGILSGMWHYLGDVRMQFTALIALFAAVPFAAGRWIVARAKRVAFWKWMCAATSCFVMMSFLLILLANVKGDVQDGFIQKVKFISSHAMIALWIGYGLVFAAAALARVKKIPRLAIWGFGALLMIVTFTIPMVQNYCNDRLVFEMGGSEQNSHTFGWQFGAYQLDGAKAINEQLVADEEPLPDPTYPPRMDDFAIFFGGTDPGRFVPTYMIYSAEYRPDVYLITQNALADDTYMSVERDLYGDEIWIPSKDDSAQAFNIYVDEVQRGVRQANGDLKIENGRVQVTGALGVMEINGILTRMMFEHDRLRHSFYVEESYAIPWMYPYLSPHGLIMKINKDRTPYDRKRAAQDRDFWDWYTRRLLKDPMYERDFAGQKSFSKLRAAIAGLYARQNRTADSAQAFREACLLYPASPEASFRYAQEILLGSSKFDVALELMDYTDELDPRNTRTARLRGYVERISGAVEAVRTLTEKLRTGKISSAERLTLAESLFTLGRTQEAGVTAAPLADMTLSGPGDYHALYQLLMEARQDAAAEKALTKLLRMAPEAGAEPWLDLARLRWRKGAQGAAATCFSQAVRLDRAAVGEKASRDEELQKIYEYISKNYNNK